MGKIDKKVLKILKTRQFEDLDAEDIAMQAKCDEEDVLEALGSLKDQGLVESNVRDKKTFWRFSADEPIEKPMKEEQFDEPKPIDTDTVSFDISTLKPQSDAPGPAPKKEAPESTIDFFSVADSIKQPEVVKPVAPTPIAPEPEIILSQIPVPPPVVRAAEPVKVQAENPVSGIPVAKEPPRLEKDVRHEDYIHDDDDDDTDHDVRPSRKSAAFPVIGIAIAIVFSVVISAVIAMMVASSASKEVSGGLGELEKKVTEANAKQAQRIESLAQKINTIAEKPASVASQTKAASPGRSVKPIAPKPSKQVEKRSHAPKKKKGKSSTGPESSTSSSTGESPSATESSPPPAPEPAPAAETSPAPSEPATGAPDAPAPSEGSGQ
jgi:hypothetical protein